MATKQHGGPRSALSHSGGKRPMARDTPAHIAVHSRWSGRRSSQGELSPVDKQNLTCRHPHLGAVFSNLYALRAVCSASEPVGNAVWSTTSPLSSTDLYGAGTGICPEGLAVWNRYSRRLPQIVLSSAHSQGICAASYRRANSTCGASHSSGIFRA
jgi:hypothetical protein